MGENLLGGCSTWRINMRSCQWWGSFTNTFFSNHFSFFQSWRYLLLKIKPWPKLWKYLFLKLIVKRFQRLCHVQLDLDIFVKLTVQIRIALEKQWRGGNASHKGEVEILMGKGDVPLCNTVILKLYCLPGYCKRFYRIPLFTIFMLFYLFCIYWDWQGQRCKLKCRKVYGINSELYCNCNFCLSSFLRYKHLCLQPYKNTFRQGATMQKNQITLRTN